jgi:hypothetical protein
MDRVESKLRLSDETFKRHVGTSKKVFHTMLGILHDAYEKEHARGGSPPKICVGDRLLIALQYYREYRTMEHIGADFGCSKCTVFRAIRWVETTLAADKRFQLRDKQLLQKKSPKTIAVDVTEHPIVRPKKPRNLLLRQEKAAHAEVATYGR